MQPAYDLATGVSGHLNELALQLIAATADTVALLERPGFETEGAADGKVAC